jgi:hypothetical protein
MFHLSLGIYLAGGGIYPKQQKISNDVKTVVFCACFSFMAGRTKFSVRVIFHSRSNKFSNAQLSPNNRDHKFVVFGRGDESV